MFVESQIEDFLKIQPSIENLEKTIYQILSLKYKNKYIPNTGLGIFVKNDYKILEKKCVEDSILYKINFNVIFFRFLKDEILEGIIFMQNENGVNISLPFFDKIIILLENLPDNSEITYIYDEFKNKKLSWVWNYKNNRFIMKTGESVKFKIIGYDKEKKRIIGSFNGFGLGPVSWWE